VVKFDEHLGDFRLPSTTLTLEQRIAALEKEVAGLKQARQATPAPVGREWLDDLYGKFSGDPVFEEAMKLGRQYRQSLTRADKRKSKAKSKR
jgi:hypothetical protein